MFESNGVRIDFLGESIDAIVQKLKSVVLPRPASTSRRPPTRVSICSIVGAPPRPASFALYRRAPHLRVSASLQAAAPNGVSNWPTSFSALATHIGYRPRTGTSSSTRISCFPDSRTSRFAIRTEILRHWPLALTHTRDRTEARRLVQRVELLTRDDVRALFPGSRLLIERFCGLPKSLIAFTV